MHLCHYITSNSIDFYSLLISGFITVLLQNIGTHVDPIMLIQKIPNGMEIPGLRDSLVKILHDYTLQVSYLLLNS